MIITPHPVIITDGVIDPSVIPRGALIPVLILYIIMLILCIRGLFITRRMTRIIERMEETIKGGKKE